MNIENIARLTVVSALLAACNGNNSTSEVPFDQALTQKQNIQAGKIAVPAGQELLDPHVLQAAPAAAIVAPLNEFRIPARLRSVIGGSSTMHRREMGFRFAQNAVIPALKFAKPNAPDADQQLKNHAARFLTQAGAATIEAASLRTVDEAGLLKVDQPAEAGVAYWVRDSGSFSLFRAPAAVHETTVHDSEDAVVTALSEVVDRALVKLAKYESLEVAAVQSDYMGATGDNGAQKQQRVSYRVLFGRSYAGVPVMGPPLEVSLDSEGHLAQFRKGWRDIVGEDGVISIASDAVVDSRRDAVLKANLNETEQWCGYAEDIDPNAVQSSPGAACRFVYDGSASPDPLNRRPEDIVNVAENAAIRPLNGVRRTFASAKP